MFWIAKWFLGESYWGKVIIHFGLKKLPAKQLFLDFRGVKIANLRINEEPSSDENMFRNHKVYLNTGLLKTGEANKV